MKKYVVENNILKNIIMLRKKNMLAYKWFDNIYSFYIKEGNFKGNIYYHDDYMTRYELKIPADSMFNKVHGEIKLYYTVNDKKKKIIMEDLVPSNVFNFDYQYLSLKEQDLMKLINQNEESIVANKSLLKELNREKNECIFKTKKLIFVSVISLGLGLPFLIKNVKNYKLVKESINDTIQKNDDLNVKNSYLAYQIINSGINNENNFNNSFSKINSLKVNDFNINNRSKIRVKALKNG